jgi:ribonuclease P protein component
MISQKYRFHGHNSLRFVFANGQMTRSKFFTIKWVVNERRHYPRLAVVVSKKIFKSAVKRNRIRRRVYEIARPLLLGAPAVDIVISVYATEVLDAPHDELAIQLLPLLHEVGLKPQITHK